MPDCLGMEERGGKCIAMFFHSTVRSTITFALLFSHSRHPRKAPLLLFFNLGSVGVQKDREREVGEERDSRTCFYCCSSWISISHILLLPASLQLTIIIQWDGQQVDAMERQYEC